MSDPLSITSALIAIITATIQSSQALYRTVQSFKNHQRTVKQLVEELEGLGAALRSLEDLSRDDEVLFAPLKQPLLQCAESCREFEALLVACSKNSGGPRTSFREWFKLRYMESDVAGFTNMLAGYKSTISIALADANLRSTKVTLDVLNDYKAMIQSTTQDLEDHLGDIDAKLQRLMSFRGEAEARNSEINRIQNEKNSTEKCLEICFHFMTKIDEMRFQPASSQATPLPGVSAGEITRADAMTLSTLMGCRELFSDTISQLQKQQQQQKLEEAQKPPRPESGSSELTPSIDLAEEVERLRGEVDSTRQRLGICTEASERAASAGVHVLEDVTVGDDAEQLFVSTLGDLFNVKGARAGDRSIMFIGSVSDAVLQEHFKTRTRLHRQ